MEKKKVRRREEELEPGGAVCSSLHPALPAGRPAGRGLTQPHYRNGAEVCRHLFQPEAQGQGRSGQEEDFQQRLEGIRDAMGIGKDGPEQSHSKKRSQRWKWPLASQQRLKEVSVAKGV